MFVATAVVKLLFKSPAVRLSPVAQVRNTAQGPAVSAACGTSTARRSRTTGALHRSNLCDMTSLHLCACGCGEPVRIAPITARRINWIKGQPITFVHGHNRRRPLHERFWKRVDKEGPVVRPALGPCWLWRGTIFKDTGYGSFTYSTGVGHRTRTVSAHRYSYESAYGPIPGPKGSNPRSAFVMHACDVRLCVRPDHLSLGSAHANSEDMVAKGRNRVGERHPLARLTTAAVLEIREAYARRETQAVLAARYGMHQTTIHAIIHGKIWRQVGGPTVQRRMNTRLTDKQVIAIRTRHSLGVIGVGKLAEMYGTSRQTIYRIVRGRQRRGVRT